MAITVSSRQNSRRKLEDELRNSLIEYMKKELGFPSSSILKEKSLASLKDLVPPSQKKPPLRRVDIAVTIPEKQRGLTLFMIVECKLDLFFEEAISQLKGYHHHLFCPFIWVASEKRSMVLFWEKGEYVPYLGEMIYLDLVEKAKSFSGSSYA